MLLMLLVCVMAMATVSGSDVIVGTSENFSRLISDNEHVLVEFYAPWCGHCKNLEPEYEKAATTLAEQGSAIKLVKVDATVETDLASTYGIQGYPTLKFFRSGIPIEYESGRTAGDIVSWVIKKSGPPSTTLANADAVAAFVAERPAVVGTFADGSADLETFIAAAKASDDFKFGNTVGDKTVITLYTVDEGEKVYQGEISASAITAWVKAEGYPALQELDQHVWQRSSTSRTSLFVIFCDPEDTSVMAVAQEVAKANKGKVQSTFMNSNTNGQLAERWGASGNVFPTACLISYAKEEPALFVWDEENEAAFNAEGLQRFIDNGLAGTYKNYRKSEPIPAENNGPVTVIVGKTYEQIVMDNSKDVIVEYYAPWCGHCKQLAPTYEELGKKFANVDSVVIAKIDATANSFDGVDVQGFPTIYLFPANDKTNPILYEGSRELQDLVDWVSKNAATDVTQAAIKEDL